MEKGGEEEKVAAGAGAGFPSDLLPEVLSRVPYRSLCRFKCVSMAWLALCSDPAVRKRSPQTLSGFFCRSPSGPLRVGGIRFFNLSGRGQPMIDPSLPFLRGYGHVALLNCCGGILLCSGWDRTMERRVYVVCNPATEEIWAALPVPDTQEPAAPLAYAKHTTCLCFDPAVPGRFTVFAISRGHISIGRVEVYSSDTGEWTSMASGWAPGIKFLGGELRQAFFLNGTLHFSAYYRGADAFVRLVIVTVDIDGSTWRTIGMPPKVVFPFIGPSQGRLYCMDIDVRNDCRLSVWVLEDYASGQWTLKQTTSILEVLQRQWGMWLAIHPEHNLIFLTSRVKPKETLLSYDMDNKILNVICTLEEHDSGTVKAYPYIPCFVEWPSDA